jgi:hypothetical protein
MTYYDSHGIPILVGDMIRTFHFFGRRRKRHYLYHGVRLREGVMELVPVHECITGEHDGGCCWLKSMCNNVGEMLNEGEIVVGYPYPEERKPRITERKRIWDKSRK